MTVLKRKLEKSPKKHTRTPIKAISALAFKNVSLLKIKKIAITVLQNVFKLLFAFWLTALGFSLYRFVHRHLIY